MSTSGKPLRVVDEAEELEPEQVPAGSRYWDYVAWCEKMRLPVGSYYYWNKMQQSVSDLSFS
jgi:hypothetical protein